MTIRAIALAVLGAVVTESTLDLQAAWGILPKAANKVIVASTGTSLGSLKQFSIPFFGTDNF